MFINMFQWHIQLLSDYGILDIVMCKFGRLHESVDYYIKAVEIDLKLYNKTCPSKNSIGEYILQNCKLFITNYRKRL